MIDAVGRTLFSVRVRLAGRRARHVDPPVHLCRTVRLRNELLRDGLPEITLWTVGAIRTGANRLREFIPQKQTFYQIAPLEAQISIIMPVTAGKDFELLDTVAISLALSQF